MVVAFVEDGGWYPRAAPGDASAAYWRAIAVMAATLRTVGRTDWTITVSTNRPPRDAEVLAMLDRSGVAFRDTPFDHRPPEGWFDRFSGSLYLLDALTAAVETTPAGHDIMLVDPDCIWVRDPAPMVAAIDADPDRILAYQITHSPGQPALGLTSAEMGDLFRATGRAPVPACPPYAGGEFLYGTRTSLARLLPHVERIWEASHERFRVGDPVKANTEEHVLSYALGQVGWPGGTANPWMRRLWTQSPPNRNVRGDEESLVLWHCLTEKRRGLLELFEDVRDGHPAMAEAGPRYRRHLARRLRVRAGPVRRLKFAVNRRVYRLRGGSRVWPVEW